MAFVTLDSNGNVTAIFAVAQSAPTPPGYTTIDDTDPRIATFEAAVTAALNPPASLTFLQFMALFTSAEQDALVTSTDTQTKLFILMASGSGSIQLNNSEVIAGVNYVASIGIITTARAAQVLAGTAPPTS